MIDAGKLATMTEWANRFGATVQTKGEVGFGRPCVGIVYGQSYVDLSDNDYLNPEHEVIYPPDGVEDAYHKHDCMAVLVHGDRYDAALEQLWTWVTWCIEENIVIVVEARKTHNADGLGRQLELMMGGHAQARLARS